MNRKGLKKKLQDRFKVELSREYRGKKSSCIMYQTVGMDIFIELDGDSEFFQSDESNSQFLTEEGKSILLFMIPSYLRITKVLLAENKVARRRFNQIVKNNFIFAGEPFGNYFKNTGALDLDKILRVSGQTKEFFDYVIFDEITNSYWGSYNPYSDSQLKLREWLEN